MPAFNALPLRDAASRWKTVAVAVHLLATPIDAALRRLTLRLFPWSVDAILVERGEDTPEAFQARILALLTPEKRDPLLREELDCLMALEEQSSGDLQTPMMTPLPLLLPPPCVNMHTSVKEKTTAADRVTRRLAFAGLKPILEECSRVSGRPVSFHLPPSGIVFPPSLDHNEIGVHPNTIPSGSTVDRLLYEVYGHNLDGDGCGSTCRSPAPGRGQLLQDAVGESVVQVVGTDVYLLFPTLSVYHGRDTEDIFRAALSAAWDKIRTNGPVGDPAGQDTPEAFDGLLEWPRVQKGYMDAKMQETQAGIAEARKKLAQLLRQEREVREITERVLSKTFMADVAERLPREREAVLAHPLVARLGIVPGGLRVETRPILVPYGGRTYDLGRFVIWIGDDLDVSVWVLEAMHPLGVAHPHIGTSGNPCFGNATEGIAAQVADYRFGNAVTLILRWLAEGYAPEVADTKIEEWPSVAP